MAGGKDLIFWEEIVDFPFSNLDLLHFDQLLLFFQYKALATAPAHRWTQLMRDNIRVHFNSCGLHEVPDCLDIHKKGE